MSIEVLVNTLVSPFKDLYKNDVEHVLYDKSAILCFGIYTLYVFCSTFVSPVCSVFPLNLLLYVLLLPGLTGLSKLPHNTFFTLLSGSTLSLFAPLQEQKSSLLDGFEAFIEEFKACFGDTDSIMTTINKIHRPRQRHRPTLTYVADFRLLASNIP